MPNGVRIVTYDVEYRVGDEVRSKLWNSDHKDKAEVQAEFEKAHQGAVVINVSTCHESTGIVVCIRDSDDVNDAIGLVLGVDCDAILTSERKLSDLIKAMLARQTEHVLIGKLTGPLDSLSEFRNSDIHWLPPRCIVNAELDGKAHQVKLGITDYQCGDGNIVKSFTVIEGGSTGNESVWISKDFINKTCEDGWSACAGGGGWKSLFIPSWEMERAHRELYSRVYQNQSA